MTRSNVEKVMVTAGPSAPRDGAIIQTPEGKNDLQVKLLSKAQQIAIRTLRTYLQSLVGFLVAGGTGAIGAITDAVGVELNIPARDFVDLLVIAASLSVAPAAIALLQNTVELLADLEHAKPEWRA
jgi:hypothetical protein